MQIKEKKIKLGLSERELGNPMVCKRFHVCPQDWYCGAGVTQGCKIPSPATLLMRNAISQR